MTKIRQPSHSRSRRRRLWWNYRGKKGLFSLSPLSSLLPNVQLALSFLFSQLDTEFNVIVIDRANYKFHNIAALRASVLPTWAHKTVIPYGKALKYGMVIQADVTSIAKDHVEIAFGESGEFNKSIPFEYCVIATGSSYAFPCKTALKSSSESLKWFERVARSVKKANRIAIIGGGPVG